MNILVQASFLSNRRSAVKINGTISSWLPDIIGVPQGGALSPLLFILYSDGLGLVNDITGLNFGTFEDDFVIFSSQKKKKHIQESLQNGINFIHWYMLQHGLIMNYSKTQYKIFGSTNRIPEN